MSEILLIKDSNRDFISILYNLIGPFSIRAVSSIKMPVNNHVRHQGKKERERRLKQGGKGWK